MRIRKANLRGTWGLMIDGNIILSNQLKDYVVPSRQQVEAHERMHKWIQEKQIKLSEKEEEYACLMWEIISSDDYHLSDGDKIVKKIIRARLKHLTRQKLVDNLKYIKGILK